MLDNQKELFYGAIGLHRLNLIEDTLLGVFIEVTQFKIGERIIGYSHNVNFGRKVYLGKEKNNQMAYYLMKAFAESLVI